MRTPMALFALAVCLPASAVVAATQGQEAMRPMTSREIEAAVVGHAIVEVPGAPDQGSLAFLPDHRTRRDGFVRGIPGRFQIVGNRIIVTEQLQAGAEAVFSIELFIGADRRMFYRYRDNGRDDEPRPLHLMPMTRAVRSYRLMPELNQIIAKK